jgi:hypothetical protein
MERDRRAPRASRPNRTASVGETLVRPAGDQTQPGLRIVADAIAGRLPATRRKRSCAPTGLGLGVAGSARPKSLVGSTELQIATLDAQRADSRSYGVKSQVLKLSASQRARSPSCGASIICGVAFQLMVARLGIE